MKPLKIHIGGLTEPKNISEVAKLYPEFMGFVFYSFTPKYYRYQSLPKIPSSIKKIGFVFINPFCNVFFFNFARNFLRFLWNIEKKKTLWEL